MVHIFTSAIAASMAALVQGDTIGLPIWAVRISASTVIGVSIFRMVKKLPWRNVSHADVPASTDAKEPTFASVLSIPLGDMLQPSGQWENRFEVKSATTNRAYIVAQHKRGRYWSCSCPDWNQHRHCKHLSDLLLPPNERPHEVSFETVALRHTVTDRAVPA